MLQLSAPANKINTSVLLSGSKSISNRLLILQKILGIKLHLSNVSDSEDTLQLINALDQLTAGSKIIDIGHAGSDMRFLTALLSVSELTTPVVLTGSERMKQRPVGELVGSLRSLGAQISYMEQPGFPPLAITGTILAGGELTIDASISSQFISALLLIAPAFKKGLKLHLTGAVVSRPYIEMTITLLRQLGIFVECTNNSICVHPGNNTTPTSSALIIESDWSSASYWYSICALSPGSEIELKFLNQKSLQADSILPTLFEQLGVTTLFKDRSVYLSSNENKVKEFNYDFTECPDIAQTLAVVCFALGIPANLTGLRTLKIKETDRISALKNEIEKFGVSITAQADSVFIPKNSILRTSNQFLPAFNINTYQDHRMAMSFAPLALVCKKLSITNPEVIHKSYPRFWDDLKSAGFNVNLQP